MDSSLQNQRWRSNQVQDLRYRSWSAIGQCYQQHTKDWAFEVELAALVPSSEILWATPKYDPRRVHPDPTPNHRLCTPAHHNQRANTKQSFKLRKWRAWRESWSSWTSCAEACDQTSKRILQEEVPWRERTEGSLGPGWHLCKSEKLKAKATKVCRNCWNSAWTKSP